MLFLALLSVSLSLKPLYLIAGFGQSPIYSTVTQPELYSECPEVKNLMIRTATTTNTNFINNNQQCLAKLLRVQLNEETGKVEQLPGIITNSSEIGDPDILSSTFGDIILKAKAKGYVSNQNLFSVGYNYLLHPITSFSVYEKLKSKIEEVYSSTKEKAVLVSFSQGTSFTSIFLSNYSTPEWVTQYIDSVIFLAPAFAGWPSFSQLMTQSLSPFPNSEEMRKTIMRMPGLHIMLPNYEIFKHRTIIYNLYQDFDQHNASYVFDFLKAIQKVDDESETIYRSDVEKYLKVPIPEPPVPSLIVYNDGKSQTVSYSIYRHQNNITNSLYNAPGDGTVTSDGAEYACGHWKSVKCTNMHNSLTHSNILKDSTVIDTVFNFVDLKEPVKEEQKIGLFLCSGFQGSPLYATVTDPEKAPMCPPNLRNFLFYTVFVNNLYKFVDDKSSSYWLSEECLAMLTRVELDESEKFVTYAPGIHLRSSPFGDYNHLLSYDGIIARAYKEGYTHRRNLFGVGYNYMLHPLMSNEIYEEMKQNIEKYYNETGMRSVVTGHSQGTSFVEIFITDYVTKEWAQKYVAGVIFYAPAFSGWGTYARSVSGSYGGIFPDSTQSMKTSTARMPGLHIMMPNEGVYGDKTVIKNFPNDGDNSNASYVSDLLKQLGRMDDTAYKIFQLTDKYRKPPLPEPPVPSLVIYNDYSNTGNGYTYNKDTNSVSSFSGKGDGTVSDDGPVYACSHWENVSCFNYHRSGISHSSIQTAQETLDLTFEFIEKVKHKRPLPKDKTVFFKGVEGVYEDNYYLNSHRVSNDKFTASSSGDKSSNPLANAFDDDEETFWIADKENDDNFFNSIIIKFKGVMNLEGFIYSPAYFSNAKTREFAGFPTRVNVYTANGNDDYQLNYAFIGTPVFPWTKIQFIFNETLTCDRIKLEFDDVTSQKMSGTGNNPIAAEILLLEHLNYDTLFLSEIKGHYSDDCYVNSLYIRNDRFTVTSDGDKANYPLSNAFDNDNKTYWIADRANDADFVNSLLIEFKERTTIEAILYDTAFFTSNQVRTFHGFPTAFTIYTANNNEEFKISAVFIGNPVYPMYRIQFVFKEPIQCDKLKLEFTEVTKQTMSGSSKNPVAGNIFLIESKSSIDIKSVEGNYNQQAYVTSHRVPNSEFTYEVNGGERGKYLLTNLFDNDPSTYWMSGTANTDEFFNTITVEFNSSLNIEGFLYDTGYSTSGTYRAFHGFPRSLFVYTASGIEDYKLVTLFKGNPVYPWKRVQFIFDQPIKCDKIKLEFDNVTDQTMIQPPSKNAFVAEIILLKLSDSEVPTEPPTEPPTKVPTELPTKVPTELPTKVPTEPPTKVPTERPTKPPTEPPTQPPTEPLTAPPTKPPTEPPTRPPTEPPTEQPPTPHQPIVDSITCSNGERRCEFEGSSVSPVIIAITSASFMNIKNEQKGGAVYLANSGFNGKGLQFVGCQSNSGVGGGLCIDNKADLSLEITLDSTSFVDCKATFGSGVYLYSPHISTPVAIEDCTFSMNSASAPSNMNDHYSFGGSALFLAAKKGILAKSLFSNNKGEGGALKICNHFDESKQKSVSIKESDVSFVVSNCNFEIEENSKCAIFFVRGKKGSSYELKDCYFNGKLSDGAHYVDGQFVSQDSPRLLINSCKFADTYERSLNRNEDYIEMDLNNQEFKTPLNNVNDKRSSSNNATLIYVIVTVICVVVIVLAVVLIVIITKKRTNPNTINASEFEMSGKERDVLLNSSLF